MSTFDRMKKAGHSLPEIWGTLASEKLNGRTIVECRYLTDEEARDLYWDRKCLAIILDDGSYLFPSADDEGNDAGALFTSWEDLPTIPVI